MPPVDPMDWRERIRSAVRLLPPSFAVQLLGKGDIHSMPRARHLRRAEYMILSIFVIKCLLYPSPVPRRSLSRAWRLRVSPARTRGPAARPRRRRRAGSQGTWGERVMYVRVREGGEEVSSAKVSAVCAAVVWIWLKWLRAPWARLHGRSGRKVGCSSDVTWRGVCETRGRRVGTARQGVASHNVKMYCNTQGAKAENRHVSAACPIRAVSVLQARSSTLWCVATPMWSRSAAPRTKDLECLGRQTWPGGPRRLRHPGTPKRR